MKGLTSQQISFEFFPPKTPEGTALLQATAVALARYQPDFFSVTFGAGGSTRKGTIETVSALQKISPVNVAPHLACIGSGREELIAILNEYKLMGVKRIVALRGDLPSGMGQAGDFKYASELVALIRETTGQHFVVEVAAYPEFHPQAGSPHADILNLKRKQEAGANRAITQYFFNPDAYFYYLDDCQKHGIDIPIVPGIMPITQFGKLARFSETCGAEIPNWIRKRLQAYGDDTESIKAFGIDVIYHLCRDLMAGGAPGLHFYTLNHAETCQILLEKFKLQPVKKLEVAMSG
jgi:methylenetetrahydrofolate reductase (NADPH)